MSDTHYTLQLRVVPQACAAQCDALGATCNAFTWTSRDKNCRLQRAEIMGACDLASSLAPNGLVTTKNDPGCVDSGDEAYYKDSGLM